MIRLQKISDQLFGLVLVGFLMGVAGHSIYPWKKFGVWIFVSVFSILIVLICALWQKKIARALLLIILAILIGVWRFDVAIPSSSNGLLPWMNGYAEIQGRIVSVGKSSSIPLVTVQASNVSKKAVSGPGRKVMTRVPSLEYKTGGLLKIACRLKIPTNYSTSFDRRKYLAGKDVWSECQGTALVLDYVAPKQFDLLAGLADLRRTITSRLESILPSDEAALLAGILYGEQDFTIKQRDLYQRAGLMHIVAVSGSNVTILVSILLPVFIWIGLRRRHAFWFMSFALMIFVGFVGFSASVMRAAFMGWLVLLARHAGRIAWTSWLLLFAAASLNLLNPWVLAFDAGFALSFLATWGILSWTPIFARRLKFLPNTLGLREIMATTCGATLMTAPYLSWAFSRESLIGLLTNLLALPLIPWTMLWGTVAIMAAKTAGSWFFSLPVFGLLKTINMIAGLADHFSWFDLKFKFYSFYFMAATYLCLWRLYLALIEEKSYPQKKKK